MPATILNGSQFTITDGQDKNRQFLTATGRPRLAAATLLKSFRYSVLTDLSISRVENMVVGQIIFSHKLLLSNGVSQ